MTKAREKKAQKINRHKEPIGVKHQHKEGLNNEEKFKNRYEKLRTDMRVKDLCEKNQKVKKAREQRKKE